MICKPAKEFLRSLDVVHAMFHVLESFCMLAVLRGSMLHVQHLSCRERYATCIMKTQGMVSFGTPILRVKSTWVSKGYQNLPKHSIRSGSDNECGLHMSMFLLKYD